MRDEQRPTVRSRRLGMMLRQIREERGLSTHAAARLLNRSQASISKLETGHRGIHRPSLENMLDRYGVRDPELRETLFRLARNARTPGWWQSYGGTLSPEAMDLIGLEADAAAIGFFELILIPGLLQTEAYARALLGQGSFSYDPKLIDRLVDVRMKRQRILARPRPPAVRAVLDEAALRREVGGPEIMRAQLRHLIEASHRPDITLQVLPFSAGAYLGMVGAFTLMDIGPHGDLQVATIDSLSDMSYREETNQVRGYSQAFDRLCATALGEADTRALIQGLLSNS
ncbi:helix-turn-helix domain-containing protein [Actinomadura scrupuli]|uniref:helix-turn-helix domain-containing protein n=1 Tax=Actinomadura scrupuli TaxID=559629 RepID=UPI003D962734